MNKQARKNEATAFQIAIDGPAAAGKSTLARLLAKKLGGYYVNTGDMYRALTWAALQNNLDPEKQEEELLELLQNWSLEYKLENDGNMQLYFNEKPIAQENLRNPEVTEIVSQVAKIPALRKWMLQKQRDSAKLGIIVMEGRDIGTVIFPEAKFKFFVTASALERARRRMAQSNEVKEGATLEKVVAEIEERDRIDSSRSEAPLKAANDAQIINNDSMTKYETAALLADIIRKKLS